MLIDHFDTLGLPRQPWIEPETLKERFHRLTAAAHPDVGGDARAFAEVNAAYAVLREPGTRLRHFLELEDPGAIAGAGASIPEGLADCFMQIATLRRAVDAFVKQISGATTPVAKALLASERFTIRHDVEKALGGLESMQNRCLEIIQGEDVRWKVRKDTAAISRLSAVQQELAYLEKWMGQLREASVSLED